MLSAWKAAPLMIAPEGIINCLKVRAAKLQPSCRPNCSLLVSPHRSVSHRALLLEIGTEAAISLSFEEGVKVEVPHP